MPTFQEMIEDPESVSREAFPFLYLSANQYVNFRNPNTMVVEGSDWSHLYDTSPETGRLHFMVKPSKTIRVRLHSNKVGFFGFRSDFPQYALDAFDIDINSPFLTDIYGTNSSTMDITLRGNSMLAAVAGNKGDRGVWSSQDDPFHRETEIRDITQPNETFRDDSILLSLTAPYGDYSTRGTYTLRWNQHIDDIWVTILNITDAPEQGFDELTDWTEIDPEIIDDESPTGDETWEYSRTFTILRYYAEGVNKDGREWTVQIGELIHNEKWVVLVDGAIVSDEYDSYYTAQDVAELKAEALRQQSAEPTPHDFTWDVAAFGGILLGVVVLLVAVYGFSRGKGGV